MSFSHKQELSLLTDSVGADVGARVGFEQQALRAKSLSTSLLTAVHIPSLILSEQVCEPGIFTLPSKMSFPHKQEPSIPTVGGGVGAGVGARVRAWEMLATTF